MPVKVFGNSLGPIVSTDFPVQPLQVRSDRRNRDAQSPSDLLVGHAAGDQVDDLCLSWSES